MLETRKPSPKRQCSATTRWSWVRWKFEFPIQMYSSPHRWTSSSILTKIPQFLKSSPSDGKVFPQLVNRSETNFRSQDSLFKSSRSMTSQLNFVINSSIELIWKTLSQFTLAMPLEMVSYSLSHLQESLDYHTLSLSCIGITKDLLSNGASGQRQTLEKKKRWSQRSGRIKTQPLSLFQKLLTLFILSLETTKVRFPSTNLRQVSQLLGSSPWCWCLS